MQTTIKRLLCVCLLFFPLLFSSNVLIKELNNVFMLWQLVIANLLISRQLVDVFRLKFSLTNSNAQKCAWMVLQGRNLKTIISKVRYQVVYQGFIFVKFAVKAATNCIHFAHHTPSIKIVQILTKCSHRCPMK